LAAADFSLAGAAPQGQAIGIVDLGNNKVVLGFSDMGVIIGMRIYTMFVAIYSYDEKTFRQHDLFQPILLRRAGSSGGQHRPRA